MSGTPIKWLKDRDVEGILNSQTVVITCLLNSGTETITLPRYSLEKHSFLFKEELGYHDIVDPAKKQQAIPLSLNTWYHRHGMRKNQHQSELDVLRDWNMLQIFCKWTLCGRIIGSPMAHPKDVHWGSEVDPLWMADIAYFILEASNNHTENEATGSI